jgi:hypothetical protein
VNNIKNSSNFVLWMLSVGLLTALCISAGVGLYGWLRGWQTAVEFSNGMFIAGAGVILLGGLAIAGGFTSRGNFAIPYSRSASEASGPERTKQMMVEILRGYNALVFSSIAGVTLIGLSILIYTLFG